MRRTASGGQSVLEYAIALALLVVVVIWAFIVIGPQQKDCFGCSRPSGTPTPSGYPYPYPFLYTQVPTP
jgi:hypothetical protein